MPTPTQRIAFLHSSWHGEIVRHGEQAFLAELDRQAPDEFAVDSIEVPGVFEIPLHARRLARRGEHQAIVAAGLVVDGGIYRHEYVAESVLNALMSVQLDSDVPVISLVLTPHHFHEHDAHSTFFAEHMKLKGAEAARACVRTLDSLARLAA
jgi:6,7-dimethyl-8-ribityllumazine synthase